MADIFLSYASEDRERVRPLVEALQADGFSVWWDRNIRPGPSFLNSYFYSIAMIVVRQTRPVDIAGLDTPWQELARVPYGMIAGYPQGRESLRVHAEHRTTVERARVIQEVVEDYRLDTPNDAVDGWGGWNQQ